jgi:cysteine desulfurase/selenocysteine lyase
MNLDYSKDFPYKDRIYLNNASASRMPRSSISAMSDFLVKYNELGPDSEASDNYVKERLASLRKEISELIKCRLEEVILTQSVTDGINFVANGLELNLNSNIVIRGSTHEHPANHYAWIRAGQRAELRNLFVDETGYFEMDSFNKIIDEKTGLVVLSHALFNTGAILSVEEIGKILSEKSIPYFVDAVQTVGSIDDVDVNKINCNFMSFNGSKWLCGPMGIGIFFCKRDSSDLIEPLQVGGESAIFHENKIVHKEMPARFQAGFRNWLGVTGLEASLIYLKKIGMKTIRERNIMLANLLRDDISKINGVTLYGPEKEEKRTSIVSFSIQDKDSKNLVAKLEKQNIILAVRDILTKKIVRASPHFFNTESEIQTVVDAIKRV